MMRNLLMLVLVSLSILLSSCGTMQTYEGEKRPQSEVATLKVETMWLGQMSIWAVDGKKLGITKDKVELLPGKHEIALHAPYARDFRISFTAEAGQAYVLRRKDELLKTAPDMDHYIENLNTGQVVVRTTPRESKNGG